MTSLPGAQPPAPPSPPPATRVGAVVLAGGRSRRFGRDKLAEPTAEGTLLEGVLAAVAEVASSVVVVGPPRDLPAGVLQTQEEPAYSGPFAAVARGLDLVEADVVLVLAGDLRRPGPALRPLLDALAGAPEAEAAVLVDSTGRRQPLLAAYRVPALVGVVVGVDAFGRPASALLDGLHVLEVPDPGDSARDVDVPDDLAD